MLRYKWSVVMKGSYLLAVSESPMGCLVSQRSEKPEHILGTLHNDSVHMVNAIKILSNWDVIVSLNLFVLSVVDSLSLGT